MNPPGTSSWRPYVPLVHRFGFTTQPTARFDPHPAAISRISLTWWEHDLDDTSPVFSGTAEAPQTLIVVWRTDAKGYLQSIDDPRVQEWRMSAATFDQLRLLHQHFHLGTHDILVRGSVPIWLSPCRESVLRLARTPALNDQVRDAIHDMERPARCA